MKPELVPALLFDLALIISLAQLLGAAARRLGQPAVIGEILTGILLGPTLFHGAISRTLFPLDVRASLAVLADVGVALFMFVVGLELERGLLRGQGRITTTVALASVLLPLTLGALLAVRLAHSHRFEQRPGFVLFLGAAMSVTAFPVLARILADRGMIRTPLGGLALACAAVDDVLAWSLLALVVVLSGGGAEEWRLVLAPVYVLGMVGVVRPLLCRVLRRTNRLTVGVLGTVFAELLLSGAATEWMGLHFIFGAFLFGVVMPRAEAATVRAELLDRMGQVSSVLLLPVFFTVSGLAVDLSGLDMSALGELGLILLVAIGGKFAGAYVGARVHGIQPRHSAVIATLVNTRGLTELVILAVGLQLGVLDCTLYSMMVVMAVVTTAMTGPMLRWIYPDARVRRDVLEPHPGMGNLVGRRAAEGRSDRSDAG
ncbi:cation:proton antiporter [Nocardia sp. NPDC051570]|uniref:cation:proton antiporter n=1 Tax=Nocardia sp. NPDC051570 TaxID=3364324 RepID=UPI0037B7A054